MKKTSIILSIAFLSVALLNSCKVEDNSVKQLNQNGMVVTSYWQTATQRILLNMPNMAFHFNAWLSASEEERPGIEDQYFNYSKIRQISDNEWAILLNGRTLCHINTGGKLLSDPGAEWNVLDYEQAVPLPLQDMLPFGKDSVRITLRHTGNKWTAETYGQEGMSSSADYIPFYRFTITPESGVVPTDLNECRCIVDGEGRYAIRTYQYADNADTPVEIHNYFTFSLTEATTENFFHWKNGLLTIRLSADMNAYEAGATNRLQYDSILIQDRLSVRSGEQYAEITMHDVTETWPIGRLREDHFECGNFFAALLGLFF